MEYAKRGLEVPEEEDQEYSRKPKKEFPFGIKVFVGNLSYRTDWRSLKDYMKGAGNVQHAFIFTDRTGRSKGCGIVEFATQEDADSAIEKFNKTNLDGREIFLREDRPKGEQSKPEFKGEKEEKEGEGEKTEEEERPARKAPKGNGGYKVGVRNLPWSVTWSVLKDEFKEFGPIIRADVFTDPNGRSKGHGFVIFEKLEDAEEAIDKMNDTDFHGRQIKVEMMIGKY